MTVAATPPTRESFHLGMARAAYLAGNLTVEQLERSVAWVLDGGTLDYCGRRPLGPFTPQELEDRVARWHEGGTRQELHTFLGMTLEEYARWVEGLGPDPARCLSEMGDPDGP